ncbi:MAG: hypothetical protein ACOY15_14060 [Pseudomonadota bacterium]
MNTPLTQINPLHYEYYENFPLIDGEFDSFDLDEELEFILEETQSATLFHKTLHLQE